MSQNFGNAFNIKPPPRSHPAAPEPAVRPAPGGKAAAVPKPTYVKVFGWRLPEGRSQEPAKRSKLSAPLQTGSGAADARQQSGHAWHVTIPHVPAHKIHHYMLLVDGQPAHDKNSDGLAVPHGPQEQQYQLMTGRGPRLFMLFAQTK